MTPFESHKVSMAYEIAVTIGVLLPIVGLGGALVVSKPARQTFQRILPLLIDVGKVLSFVIALLWALGLGFFAQSLPPGEGAFSSRFFSALLSQPTGSLAIAVGAYLLLSFVLLPYVLFVVGPIAIAFFAAVAPYVQRFWERGRFVLLAVLLTTFVGLTAWSMKLPELHGSQWNLKDTVIRLGAVLSGVGSVLVLLSILMRLWVERLERGSFPSFVGARHIRSKKSSFLTVISVLSIAGVSISSCSLSSVVSVMGGFTQDLKRKILANNAHIIVDTESQVPFDDWEQVLGTVRKIPDVVGAAPIVKGEAMMQSSSNMAGVLVRGIEPKSIQEVTELGRSIDVGRFEYLDKPELLLKLPPEEVIGLGPGGEKFVKGPDISADRLPRARAQLPGVIVGRELAKTLHVYVGDEVTLISPMGDLGPLGLLPRTRKFRIAAIFFSAMYEYDASHAYVMLEGAQGYFNTGKKVSAIEVKVKDAENSYQVRDRIDETLRGKGLSVRDWRELNRNLFSALKIEKIATFIVLSIAVIVASFSIICTLLLLVTEKSKEIAILKALGAADGAILRTFMIEGIVIGIIGTVLGVATALGLCTGLSWFGLKLDPDVYYIDRLPIAVNPSDYVTVAVSAVVICTLATIYPALAASRLRPVEGLRYE